MLSVASIFTAGEEFSEIQEVSATNKKIIYEIYTDEEGNVILTEKSVENGIVIKYGKAAPMRKNDYDMLIGGIESESLEEALMMFEDFTS